VDESIKQYLRRIGSKGGKALAGNPQAKTKAAAKAAKAIAGTPKAKARAAKAAKARWANENRKNKTKNETDKRAFKIRTWKTPNSRKRRKDDTTKTQKRVCQNRSRSRLGRWAITAPKGHVFNATECHYIVFERWKEDRSPRWGKASEGWNKIERKAAYRNALERLKLGISPDPEK
jgi:hypothetical protein